MISHQAPCAAAGASVLLYSFITPMFARRLRLDVEQCSQGPRPCPLEWMDRFFMRHFTGLSALDDTLPAGEGLLEAGLDVDLEVLRREFEQWLRGHKLLAPDGRLSIRPPA